MSIQNLTFWILLVIGLEKYESEIKISGESNRLRRVALYPDAQYAISKPELKASYGYNLTKITCTVKTPVSNAEIYLACPIFGTNTQLDHCYQGCHPIKPCTVNTLDHFDCVPHDQSIFCHKIDFQNGTVLLQFEVDHSDKRLTGMWSCVHAGLRSTKFEIDYKSTLHTVAKEVELNTFINVNHKKEVIPSEQKPNQIMIGSALSRVQKAELLYGILAVLSVSLLINFAFCIRCLMMRTYIDAIEDGSKQPNCLADCLCLPKEMRTVQPLMMKPLLPKYTANTQIYEPRTNCTNSDIYNLSYNLHQLPVLYNDAQGVNYVPGNSLPRIFQGYSAANYQKLLPQANGSMNSETLGSESNTHLHFPTNQINLSPTYIRASSVNASSPNLRRNIIDSHTAMNNSRHPSQWVLSDLNPLPQYVLRAQPQHVIYDDVAFVPSNITGLITHSPNVSRKEASMYPEQTQAVNKMKSSHNSISYNQPILAMQFPHSNQQSGDLAGQPVDPHIQDNSNSEAFLSSGPHDVNRSSPFLSKQNCSQYSCTEENKNLTLEQPLGQENFIPEIKSNREIGSNDNTLTSGEIASFSNTPIRQTTGSANYFIPKAGKKMVR